MAETKTVTYKIQVISKRYIRGAVFEDYVNGKLDEFGSEWSYTVRVPATKSPSRPLWLTYLWPDQIKRDNRIEFTAARELTNDELDKLQERSNDSNPQPLFIKRRGLVSR